MRSCVDASKAGRLPGWRPEVDLDAGLEETLRSFQDALQKTGYTRPAG